MVYGLYWVGFVFCGYVWLCDGSLIGYYFGYGYNFYLVEYWFSVGDVLCCLCDMCVYVFIL